MKHRVFSRTPVIPTACISSIKFSSISDHLRQQHETSRASDCLRQQHETSRASDCLRQQHETSRNSDRLRQQYQPGHAFVNLCVYFVNFV